LTHQNYRKSHFYEEAVRRFAAYTGKSYEIGITISAKPVEIYALLGGQWPHSSYMEINWGIAYIVRIYKDMCNHSLAFP